MKQMKIAAANLISLLLIPSAVIVADTIETLSIPTNGSSVTSTTTLEAGTLYLLQASGTFFIGGPGDGLGDADWADFSNPPSSAFDVSSDATDFGIAIDGVNPDWGEFQLNHQYTILFEGKGSTIDVSYIDGFFSDNQGNLSLRIMSIPEPSTGLFVLVGGFVIQRRRRWLQH